MNTFPAQERMHRLIKQALDSGEAESLEAAERLFRGFRLSIRIESTESLAPAHQAALLTALALARRVFLGGVYVTGALDVPLTVPLVSVDTLAAAVQQLGGIVGTDAQHDAPRVSIGGNPRKRGAAFDVRTALFGWCGGVVPSDTAAPDDGSAMPLAAMLAAALAVSEAFAFVRGEGEAPGHRDVGLSLWKPQEDWLHGTDVEGPQMRFLPSQLWIIGLGHLGQAYLWGLGLLPYPRHSGTVLLLQDIDTITPSTESTSILTDLSLVGQRKARAMAAWSESRGFETVVCERRFDAATARRDDEPGVALCGVDNGLARRALDVAGFDLVVEAGLGRGYDDFRTLRLHTLPGARPAAELWRAEDNVQADVDLPAYRKLHAEGMEQCGITLLAGKAVAAPFVGAVAASLALAELIRLLHGGSVHQVIDLDLKAIEHRAVVLNRNDFGSLNPGFIEAASETYRQASAVRRAGPTPPRRPLKS